VEIGNYDGKSSYDLMKKECFIRDFAPNDPISKTEAATFSLFSLSVSRKFGN